MLIVLKMPLMNQYEDMEVLIYDDSNRMEVSIGDHLLLIKKIREIEGVDVRRFVADNFYLMTNSQVKEDPSSFFMFIPNNFKDTVSKIIDVIYEYFGTDTCTIDLHGQYPTESQEEFDELKNNFKEMLMETFPQEETDPIDDHHAFDEAQKSWEQFRKKHPLLISRIGEGEKRRRTHLN
jgi:hypothetical protein